MVFWFCSKKSNTITHFLLSTHERRLLSWVQNILEIHKFPSERVFFSYDTDTKSTVLTTIRHIWDVLKQYMLALVSFFLFVVRQHIVYRNEQSFSKTTFSIWSNFVKDIFLQRLNSVLWILHSFKWAAMFEVLKSVCLMLLWCVNGSS